MVIIARAPLRIGFGGGGTDIEPYASEHGGRVLNAAIQQYAYCVVKNATVPTVTTDKGTARLQPTTHYLALPNKEEQLVEATIAHFIEQHRCMSAFDVTASSDAPRGAGLGGSSAVVVAVLAALYETVNTTPTHKDLVSEAYFIERELLGIPGGKQDQIAAVYGGFNWVEFLRKGDFLANPLKISDSFIAQLESKILLCCVKPRTTLDCIGDQVEVVRQRANIQVLDELKNHAHCMRSLLLDGDISGFATDISSSWTVKQKLSSKINTPELEHAYNVAMEHGAIGAKISGAGGGGVLTVIVPVERRTAVAQALKEVGTLIDARFTPHGVTTWKT